LDEATASIHIFLGFQLSVAITASRRANDVIVEKIIQELVQEQNLEYLLWVIHSCHYGKKGVTITLTYEQDLLPNLCATVASKGILCKKHFQNRLSVHLPPNTEYTCVSYSLGNDTVCVREQLSCHKVMLESLMSHELFGVDNTGNTRVWDSEITLFSVITRILDNYI
jgi:hypothetical protein